MFTYYFENGVFKVLDENGQLLPTLEYIENPTEGNQEQIDNALYWYFAAYSDNQDMSYDGYLRMQNQNQIQALSGCSPSGLASGINFNKVVSFGNDDGCWRSTTGLPEAANTAVKFGVSVLPFSPSTVTHFATWLIFRNVVIPKNSLINKAVLKFTAYDYGSATNNNKDDVFAKIVAHKTDVTTLAERVPSSTYLPDNTTIFPRTDTEIDWDIDTAWTNNTVYESPNIACVIQELVDQDDWDGVCSVKLFIEDNGSNPQDSSGIATRSYYSFEAASNKTVQLEIWYSETTAVETSGGMKIGGSNSPTVTYTYTPVDGIKIGGSLLSDPFELGGIKIGGEADIYSIFPEFGNGGIKIGSNTTVDTAIIPDGGIKIGSNTEVTVTYTVEPTGGIRIGDAYFPNGKRYRVKVTTGPNKVTLGFPVVVRLEYTEGQAINENDFIVTDVDDNLIPHVVRSFEPTIAYLMFKQDVSASSASVAYVYYGG